MASFVGLVALVGATLTTSREAAAQEALSASAPASVSKDANGSNMLAFAQDSSGAQAPTGATDAAQGPAGTPAAPGGAAISVTPIGANVEAQKPVSADAPAEEKKPAKKTVWIDKFAGSTFFTQTSASIASFAPGLTQTYNPSVEQWSSFSPRYALNKQFQLRGRLVASYEYTNSDSTTYRNEFRFSDPLVQLFYRGIPSFLGGTAVAPFIGLGFPLSKESQARTLIVTPQIGVQLARPVPHVLGGDLMFIASANYTHPFYRYTTAGLDNPPSVRPQCFGGAGTCTGQAGGVANVSDTFSWLVIATGEWGKFSPGVLFWMTHSGAYQFEQRSYEGVTAGRLQNPSSIRQTTYVAAWLDYQLNTWFTPEVGYQFARSVLDADGTYGNPLFSRYQDMRVYLGFNIGLDSLFKAVKGDGGEAGVVRANNERRPTLSF